MGKKIKVYISLEESLFLDKYDVTPEKVNFVIDWI